jgi:GNAT superfamily N-acetyltransferase
VQVRTAGPDEAARVASVLTAAAQRLAQQGRPLWSDREVDEAAIAQHVRAGRYQLALDGNTPVGAFRLDPEDALFWPEITDGSSLFLHKLAVHPDHQGRGLAHALLGRACELARLGPQLPASGLRGRSARAARGIRAFRLPPPKRRDAGPHRFPPLRVRPSRRTLIQ